MAYTATAQQLRANAADLFAEVIAGRIAVRVNQTYELAEAAQAHRDLEGRKTTGSSILVA